MNITIFILFYIILYYFITNQQTIKLITNYWRSPFFVRPTQPPENFPSHRHAPSQQPPKPVKSVKSATDLSHHEQEQAGE